MDKSKMKEIRRHVRQTDLAEQSTQPHAIGPDGVEHNKDMIDAMHYDIQYKVRREVLDELWGANKVNHQGQWYIRLTDVVNIIGDYDE